jgi:hypothetical protein
VKQFLALLLLALGLPSLAADPPPPPAGGAYFTKLRMDYAAAADFNPYWKVDPDREAIIAAYREKDYRKVFDLSEPWLAKCPVDADIHALRSTAATALGDIKGSIHDLYFAYGLMDSVIQSGDGQSPKTAFKVISVAEEYSVLREFGAQVTGQALVDGKYDQMKCKFPGGKEATVYFDVSIPLKAGLK